MSSPSTVAPPGYQNWLESKLSRVAPYREEFALYSDASFIGDIDSGTGPYRVLNALGEPKGHFGHKATLVVDYFPSDVLPDWDILGVHDEVPALSGKELKKRTRARAERNKHFSGGPVEEEIAALLSLIMGVRLRSGSSIRDYAIDQELGRARVDLRPPVYPPGLGTHSLQVPNAVREIHISETCRPYMVRYVDLQPAEAACLVRSARLYRDGLWLAESQPDLAWILFVSAIEVLAVEHQGKIPTEDLLKSAIPCSYEMLLEGELSEIVKALADELSGLLKATERFLTFLQEFRPRIPPVPEVPPAFQLKWADVHQFREYLKTIYSLRSKALHNGTPFPPVMNQPVPISGAWAEKPVGLGSASHGGIWTTAETPMTLHAFDYICRESILGWWRARSSVPEDS